MYCCINRLVRNQNQDEEMCAMACSVLTECGNSVLFFAYKFLMVMVYTVLSFLVLELQLEIDYSW